jgi:hypothetical protein
VLVNAQGVSKLCDFGLGRSLADGSYEYTQESKSGIPFKSTAPEAMRMKRFTAKSDCWAFGCLMWEVLHEESELFPHWSAQDVQEFIDNGQRLRFDPRFTQLKELPPSLSDAMNECWQVSPEARPSFQVLASKLRKVSDGSRDETDANSDGSRDLGSGGPDYVEEDGIIHSLSADGYTGYTGGYTEQQNPHNSGHQTPPDQDTGYL